MFQNFDPNQNYYSFNDKNTVPVVFIHGVGLDQRMWEPQIEAFKEYSIITYDLFTQVALVKAEALVVTTPFVSRSATVAPKKVVGCALRYTRIRSFILLAVGGSACRDKAKFFTAASISGVRSFSCCLQLARKRNSIEKIN